jgi:hypothetical protein
LARDATVQKMQSGISWMKFVGTRIITEHLKKMDGFIQMID